MSTPALSCSGSLYPELLRLRDANAEQAARIAALEDEVEAELRGQVEISTAAGRSGEKLLARIAELEASFSVAQQTASDLELKLLEADERIGGLEAERDRAWERVKEAQGAALELREMVVRQRGELGGGV